MLVDPFKGEVGVERKLRAGFGAQTLSSGRLKVGGVPGFWIEVGWLWQADFPSTVRCLRDILPP